MDIIPEFLEYSSDFSYCVCGIQECWHIYSIKNYSFSFSKNSILVRIAVHSGNTNRNEGIHPRGPLQDNRKAVCYKAVVGVPINILKLGKSFKMCGYTGL